MSKKLVLINTVTNNSTGNIMHEIQRRAMELGYNTQAIIGRRKVYLDAPCIKFGNGVSFWIHVFLTTIFDRHGYGSKYHTARIVEYLQSLNPDIIHLHNIHGYYINIPLLFDYLCNEYEGKVIWTFHDCWPLTGHCAYYTFVNCDKWIKGCNNCPNKKQYPVSLIFDRSASNYVDKKTLFTNIKNLEIVVPSEWMKNQVKMSFLKEAHISVVSNGIDLNLFDYRRFSDAYAAISDKYHIDDGKKIILGVASIWEKRKGLDTFTELSKVLSDEFQIVLIGLNRRQIRELPANVIGIERTENKDELVRFYSAAFVFINPSVEESFSLVTVEAMACGTPVIVLNTSAVGELVDCKSGIVLKEYAVSDYIDAINQIENDSYDREFIRNSVLKYSIDNMISGYMDIYDK